jgi:hypothetical protein
MWAWAAQTFKVSQCLVDFFQLHRSEVINPGLISTANLWEITRIPDQIRLQLLRKTVREGLRRVFACQAALRPILVFLKIRFIGDIRLNSGRGHIINDKSAPV